MQQVAPLPDHIQAAPPPPGHLQRLHLHRVAPCCLLACPLRLCLDEVHVVADLGGQVAGVGCVGNRQSAQNDKLKP